MSRYLDLEQNTRKKAEEIYSIIGGEVPSLFNRKKWKGKILAWSMRDADFRSRLLRFLDVMPSVKTDSALLKIFGEYFSDVNNPPADLSRVVGRLAQMHTGGQKAARILKAGLMSLARQFIAGKDSRDALDTLQKCRSEGLAVSLDIAGEEVLSDYEATQYATKYKDLIQTLAPVVNDWSEIPLLDADNLGPIPRLDVSLKVTSFYSHLDPVDWEGSIEITRKNLAEVFRSAKQAGASVTVDMEHYYLKDLTLEIFKQTASDHPDFQFPGIVIQTYLKDTEKDLLSLVEWARKHKRRPTIRLVKGAYWDYETVVNPRKGWPVPVFVEKEETDLKYEALTKILLENSEHLRPALATHNVRSLSHAIAVAESLELPKNAVEFQMIRGMAEPVRKAMQKLGFRIREYTPVGEIVPGMAYLIRRLLENTFPESFLKRSFYDRVRIEDLTKGPEVDESFGAGPLVGEPFRNEPVTDFSKSENRSRMKEALSKCKNDFDRKYPLLLGEEQIFTEQLTHSLNPARPEETVGRVSAADKNHAKEAVQRAKQALNMWRRTDPKERAEYLSRAAQVMRRRRFRLMALEVYEVGKTWKDADGDIAEAIDCLEYYGREMKRIGVRRVLGDYPGEKNLYLYEPRGVGVAITPWNFPIAIPTGMVSAAVVTGNAVVFKPSGLSPVCGWELVDIFRVAGLPPGILQFLPGPGGEIGEYLVSHPEIDFIAFTGSRDVGLKIVRLAAETRPGQRNVKRVVAEMGGKNAVIVDETADLDEAVRGVVESAMDFQGQKCSAGSRAIVVETIFEEFSSRLKQAMESLRIGPTEEPRNLFGPMVDEAAAKKTLKYIAIGLEQGSPLLVKEVDAGGFFVGPALITDVDPDSTISRDEIFGPVLILIKARDLEEAISLANNSDYALTGGVFSRSPENIEKVKNEFNVGNLYINRKITGALVGRQPFGGFRMSGVGAKSGGPDYLLQFMRARSI
ncbi:MAG: bifunctional proline dehydrogenase/L-glutamate gamma-semialdehyde dehydrogenase, partial [Desulfomonile tiedjei]|nr:bifunctional proline dehydrogenase/L-glutamate gamma-semialdehyde dehydrogenase [Desulfomonile tiedjei]